ncbi:UNKNOWN [Stylonychia lemnae]|uniref:Uncharacterized protein n=1 Tax=Stylonychia lemnae TaxID=5949 RepID=A0A078AXM5_STYLE|nr:UNKNOWN [Stylonychia lemnae]|eukprot:CDW86821.1 UNKNOWN [Stylonychia lemnae]
MIDKTIEGPSKILSKKWKQYDFDIHRQKVIEIKPLVNVSQAPMKINKSKVEQMQEDKCTEIERANRILYEKITKIKMKFPQTGLNQTQSDGYSFIGLAGANFKKSSPLNMHDIKQRQREREQRDLMKENIKLLERLRNSKATVDQVQFQDFEDKHQNYLKNIIEGPQQFNSGRSSSVVKQKEFLKNSTSNVRTYGVSPNLQNYTQNINKDFSSGLKFPQTSLPITGKVNESYGGQSLKTSDNEYDGYDQHSIEQPKNGSYGLVNPKMTQRRFQTRPKPRKSKEMNGTFFGPKGSYQYGQEIELYKTKLYVEEIEAAISIKLVRAENKVYIRSLNPTVRNGKQEIEIHLKQFTHYMMDFENNFEEFVQNTIEYKNGRIIIRDLNKKRYCSVNLQNLNASLEQQEVIHKHFVLTPKQIVKKEKGGEGPIQIVESSFEALDKFKDEQDFTFQRQDPKVSSAIVESQKFKEIDI